MALSSRDYFPPPHMKAVHQWNYWNHPRLPGIKWAQLESRSDFLVFAPDNNGKRKYATALTTKWDKATNNASEKASLHRVESEGSCGLEDTGPKSQNTLLVVLIYDKPYLETNLSTFLSNFLKKSWGRGLCINSHWNPYSFVTFH